MAIRKWQLYVGTQSGYMKPTTDGTAWANGPQNALKAFGLTDPMYSVEYSRKGYGHYTGQVNLYAPETQAARAVGPERADFILKVIK